MNPRYRRPALIATWLVATALVVACARTIDWRRAANVVATLSPAWILVAILANTAILVLWAAFWRGLLPTSAPAVAWRRMFEIVSTASSLMNTVPFGGGHASSIVLLAQRGGVGQRAALSVLALDQLGEGITKVSIFLLVALLAPLPGWMRAGVTTALLAVAAWFVTLIVASRWAHELHILKSPKRSIGALACVVGMKAAEAFGIAAVQRAFGLDITAAGTLLVLAAVVLGTMLPIAPANLGTYEASAFLAYRHLGLSSEQALSLAVVQHACFMLPAAGVGYLFVSAHTLSRSVTASQ